MESGCVVGSSAVTLHFLIEDYVLHMRHHVDHVLSRLGCDALIRRV